MNPNNLKLKNVCLIWCDSGTTEGKFTEGVIKLFLVNSTLGFFVSNYLRVHGSQIARQRQNALDQWYENIDTEWALWLDSDIFVTPEMVYRLTSVADAESCPIISGIYYSLVNPQSGYSTAPLIYYKTDQENIIQHVTDFPKNEVIKIDYAGMGFVLMHKSVIKTMREKFGEDAVFFFENQEKGNNFVGEDINFFRKVKDSGIQLHAHTGAIVDHLKRVHLNNEYDMIIDKGFKKINEERIG